MFNWFKRWRENADQVKSDAGALIERYGDLAHAEARRRTLESNQHAVVDTNGAAEHWDNVGRLIARRLRTIDTATSYLANGPTHFH
jgi:hypothetical protein